MKRFFEYVGLTVLFLFSYYYTGKIAEIMSNKDAIMVSLEEKDNTLNKECIEGYMNNEGVVLGISGLKIDMDKSYQNMKGVGYDESLIEYNESLCVVNKNNSLDKYIIKGNSAKSSVSLIIDIKFFEYIEYFKNIAKEKNIKLNFIVDDNILNKNKTELLELYEDNNDILYKGSNIKEFKQIFNNIYCVYNENNNMLDMCGKEKINTIKTDKYYNKELLLNIKKNIEKGDFIIIEENKKNMVEFSSVINYINSKGINIINISEHLR